MMGTVRVIRKLQVALLLVIGLSFAGPTETVYGDSRGVGPFKLRTRDGSEQMVRLLRRDKDTVWVLRQTGSGKELEMGITPQDVGTFVFGRQSAFVAAERATTPKQMQAVQKQLRAISRQLKPYRDLTGMIADRAMYLEAWLWERQDKHSVALKLYQDIADQPYENDVKPLARLRLGICQAASGDYEKALEHLVLSDLPSSDLELTVDVHFALGQAYTNLERYDEAAMHYLHPVVFLPYVNQIEPRCLAAVLQCYAGMEDWVSFHQTYRALLKDHPDHPATESATLYAAQFEERLLQQGLQLQPTTDDSETDQLEGEVNVL